MDSATLIQTPTTIEPWWKNGHVWLILSGPLVVIMASMITVYLAIQSPDPVLDEDYYRKGLEINKTLVNNGEAMIPALEARNHAQTGVAVRPIIKH